MEAELHCNLQIPFSLRYLFFNRVKLGKLGEFHELRNFMNTWFQQEERKSSVYLLYECKPVKKDCIINSGKIGFNLVFGTYLNLHSQELKWRDFDPVHPKELQFVTQNLPDLVDGFLIRRT